MDLHTAPLKGSKHFNLSARRDACLTAPRWTFAIKKLINFVEHHFEVKLYMHKFF